MIFPKKPQLLYAPMLATFGGGSANGFRSAAAASPVFGYAVAKSTNGANGITHFDPETMSYLGAYNTASTNDKAQNCMVSSTHLFYNYGYDTSTVTMQPKTNLDPVYGTTLSVNSESRGNMTMDQNYVYVPMNNNAVSRRSRSNWGSSFSLPIYGGGNAEIYATALDSNYFYAGGGGGDIAIFYRSNLNSVQVTSLPNFNTLSSIMSDDTHVFCTGYNGSYVNHQSIYRVSKANFSQVDHATVHFNSLGTNATAAAYTNAVHVDGTYVYTVGRSSNAVVRWNKSTMGFDSSLPINGSYSHNGSPLSMDHGKGMTADKDHLYVAGDCNLGQVIIKVKKSNMTIVGAITLPNQTTDFNFWSGGRHIAIDNMEGGPCHWYRSGVSNYNITDNESNILPS